MRTDVLKAAGGELALNEMASGSRGDRPRFAEALAYSGVARGETLADGKLDHLGRSQPT